MPPWLLQIMEMVQSSVDRALQTLSGSVGPTGNGSPGDIQTQGYAMPARTGAEVQQANPNIMQQPANIPLPTQQQVAQGLQEQDNDMFSVLSRSADPAMQQLGQGIPNQPMPQPMQQAPVTQSGLVMPPGMAPQEEVQVEENKDDVGWLL